MGLVVDATSPNTFGFTSIVAEVTSCYLEQNDGGSKMIAEEDPNYFARSWHRTGDLAMGAQSVPFQVKIF